MRMLGGVPALIASPETAAALSAVPKAERDDVLARRQVEVIDRFASVRAIGDQRRALVDALTAAAADLEAAEAADPLLREKAAVVTSVERGVAVVEGAVQRIGEVSAQLGQLIDAADTLRGSSRSLVAAREAEARAVAAQLDEQIQEQLRRLPPPSAPQNQQQQHPPQQSGPPLPVFATGYNNGASGMGAPAGSSGMSSPTASLPPFIGPSFAQLAPPPPPPPPPTFAFGAPSAPASYQPPSFTDPTMVQTRGSHQPPPPPHQPPAWSF
jgi:hypothetical protein